MVSHANSRVDDAIGIASRDADLVNAPLPAEALVSMECILVHVHDMETTHLLVGEVKRYHLADAVVQTDEKGHRTVNLSRLDPVGRVGGFDYCLAPNHRNGIMWGSGGMIHKHHSLKKNASQPFWDFGIGSGSPPVLGFWDWVR